MAKKGKHTAPAPEAQEGKSKSLLQRLRVLLIVAVAALAVASLTAMEDGVRFASLRRWLMYGESSSTQDFHVYASDSGNRYGQLGTGLLVASPNNIQFFRDSGSAAYEIPVKMKNTQMSVGQRQAAVCDVGGDSLYLLDPMGTRRKMSTERGLCYYSARLNGSDYLAVTEQKSGYKATVSVYGSQGELKFHFDSYDNYISDAVVTEDGRSLLAVTLDTQDGVFASRLRVYDLNSHSSQPTGEAVIRDGLVMDFSCNNNRMICLCDKRFVITSLDGETLLDRAYGNLYLHDYALSGDGFCALLLGRYQAGNICTLTTYDLDGEELASLPLTEEVLDISAAGSYLAVLYGNSVVVYNKDLTEHARMEGTDYAGQVDDVTVLLIAGASAWRFLP